MNNFDWMDLDRDYPLDGDELKQQQEEEIIENRIIAIIKDNGLGVKHETLLKYLEYFKKNITLPVKMKADCEYFTYTQYEKGIPDTSLEFELVGYDENIEDCTNIFAKIKTHNSEKIYEVQLFELNYIGDNPEYYQIFKDYQYWIEDML